MSNNESMVPEAGYSVVCIDCFGIQNAEKVMKSKWYAQGNLPPCGYCGGVTHEVPTNGIQKFVDDTLAGKRRI